MQPLFQTLDFNRRVTNEIFGYYRCEKCGLISLANIPEDLGPFYAHGYHAVPQSDAAMEAGANHDRYKIDLVTQFMKGGRLLEIGPSWGAFCLLAKRAGFSVEAIEMDPHCCDFLTERIGVRAIRRKDEAMALLEATQPDIIAAWHVLEHMRDPWHMIEAAAARLAPGGILVLALPNPDAFQFNLFGKYWAHVDAPRHLHLIPTEVLRLRAEAAGLNQILFTTTDHGSLGWNVFGWIYSLPHLASGEKLKRVLGIAGRGAAALARFIENREGRGAAYTAIFRKPS